MCNTVQFWASCTRLWNKCKSNCKTHHKQCVVFTEESSLIFFTKDSIWVERLQHGLDEVPHHPAVFRESSVTTTRLNQEIHWLKLIIIWGFFKILSKSAEKLSLGLIPFWKIVKIFLTWDWSSGNRDTFMKSQTQSSTLSSIHSLCASGNFNVLYLKHFLFYLQKATPLLNKL